MAIRPEQIGRGVYVRRNNFDPAGRLCEKKQGFPPEREPDLRAPKNQKIILDRMRGIIKDCRRLVRQLQE
jgi:hypothetical protein